MARVKHEERRLALQRSGDGAQKNERKKRKWHPGTVAMREMRRLQKETKTLIPYAAFLRVVRDLVNETASSNLRLQREGVKILQEALETYLHEVFLRSANTLRVMKRVTIKPDVLRLVLNSMGGDPDAVPRVYALEAPAE